MGGNYKEVWTPKTVRYQNYDATLGAAVLDTINKFDAFRTYNMSASMGTTVYGVVNFEKGKIRSVRHTIRPSISYSVNPSFEQYYDEYIIDAEGNTREYTRFQTSLFGTPGKAFPVAWELVLLIISKQRW